MFGTLNVDSDKDTGVSVELSLPKAILGLTDASSFGFSPALANQDGVGAISDGLTGVSPFLTERWPTVVLD